ncbi:4'-phosphopantetheinyl transferase family protein [Streptomyces sp. NPDC002159]
MAVLAMSWDAPVGVDVERVRDRRNLPELAASCLAPAELAHWRQRPTADCFTRLWARKEALLKARGEGFPELLDQVCTVHGPVYDLTAPPGYHAAVATDRNHPPYNERPTHA